MADKINLGTVGKANQPNNNLVSIEVVYDNCTPYDIIVSTPYNSPKEVRAGSNEKHILTRSADEDFKLSDVAIPDAFWDVFFVEVSDRGTYDRVIMLDDPIVIPGNVIGALHFRFRRC